MWQEEAKPLFEVPKLEDSHSMRDFSSSSSSSIKTSSMPSYTVPKKRNYFGRMETSHQDTYHVKTDSSSLSEHSCSSSPPPPPLYVSYQPQGIYTSKTSPVEELMDTEDPPTYYCPPTVDLMASTLAKFGLKLTEDGKGVTRHDMDASAEADRYAHVSPYSCLSPSTNSGSTDDSLSPSPTVCVSPPPGSVDTTFIVHSSTKKKVKDGTKKQKMFEMEPICDDTALEKRRLNAINAKKNREMKKFELSAHKRRIEYLEEINQRCTQALKKTHSEVQELQYQAQRHVQDLTVRDREIQEKKREIRKKREEMVLLKGHLEIISGSLDDQNPAKNLIASLLKNFSSAHEASFS